MNFEKVPTIVFSQLKATLTGKIQCIENINCEGLMVNIKPIGMDLNTQNIISVNGLCESFTNFLLLI